jgi:hypothetical protein
VVVKGTFLVDDRGQMQLAAEQQPLVAADEHYGAPDKTCVRHECDFVLHKPLTDVIVVGKAVAPHGRAVASLPVRLEVQGAHKDALVTGERRWVRVPGGLTGSHPLPFTEMPLTFDRAFGGVDESGGPGRAAAEMRNSGSERLDRSRMGPR